MSTTSDNKALIQAAFDAWAKGEGDVFRLLADDARWTVTGSSPIAGTYTSRQQFIEQAIQPLSARLSEPIRPAVQSIVAEDDTVVVVWQGHATARDGVPYDNVYCWLMRLEDGRVTEATAFFDSPLLTELFERVPVPQAV